jgi:ubiquinone biosynthesis protein
VALALDPDVNMWEISGPFIREWMRDELGPESRLADRLILNARTLSELPDFVRRVMALVPIPGAAPPQKPLPEIMVRERRSWGALFVAAMLGAAVALAAASFVLG